MWKPAGQLGCLVLPPRRSPVSRSAGLPFRSGSELARETVLPAFVQAAPARLDEPAGNQTRACREDRGCGDPAENINCPSVHFVAHNGGRYAGRTVFTRFIPPARAED